jgi:predicted RecB family nuclease
MYQNEKGIIFSPSDLTCYMESQFASWMEHHALICPELSPDSDPQDPLLSLLQKKGNAHELAILAEFQSMGLYVENLSGLENAVEKTLNAMQQGADIIYQAALQKLPFSGFADFLVKVPGKSTIGNYYYEVWDTKLSKSVKPYFVIQLCCYTEMLADIQGKIPENIVIVLGNNEKIRLKTSNYFYYYQQLKQLFLSAHLNFDPAKHPNPADSTSWGKWKSYAENLLLDADHLSQIATITRSQIKKLNQAGIQTMQELATYIIPEGTGIHSSVLLRLISQAKIQKESKGLEIPLFKILEHKPNQKQGMALLQPLSSSDIFFDIEGFPLEEGGLEYLWGITYFDYEGKREFKDLWAHNRIEEKQAFKEFIEWVYMRWQQDNTMHIYHYANYEIAACRKLMGRYGICENELDQLLRNEVFVDLYTIVKGSLIVGEPRYSIKNVEHLYREKRGTDVGSGSESVVVYDNWRENPDGDTWQTSKLLRDIRDYNIDDCNSTQELVFWLRDQQTKHGIVYLGKTEIVDLEIKEEVTARTQLRDTLLDQAVIIERKNNIDAAIMRNIAWSLEFHRRENKPVLWRLFDRLGMDVEELIDDFECLANCIRTEKLSFKPTPRARNLAYEYRFDPNQDFKGASKSYYILGEEDEDGKKCKVTVLTDESSLQEGIITVQSKNEPQNIITLVPDDYVNPDPIPAAIYAQGKDFLENPLRKNAILDFLRKSMPRIHGHKMGEVLAPSHDVKEKLQQIINAAINLDKSYLVIQGPPGAGKTYTGKHIIAELLKRGMKIGICSNSHKAINNLLISTVKYCNEIGVSASFICTSETDPALESWGVKILDNNKLAPQIRSSCVVGTTAWGFSREDLIDAFDYLVIDEA